LTVSPGTDTGDQQAWPVFDGFADFDIAGSGTTIHGRHRRNDRPPPDGLAISRPDASRAPHRGQT
jgi:hypothetical protein